MGLQDRDYNRPRTGSGNFILDVLSGDFTLGYFAGIRVRIHASLVILIGLRLAFAGPGGVPEALTASLILFGVILLHEFGHCFAARSVGGRGDDVLLWPLGGLAYIDTPKRPWPSFVGTAGGPLTNLLICAVCALFIRVMSGEWIAANPLAPFMSRMGGSWFESSSLLVYYLWWIYSTSLSLFLFNLLPIFPLDGGRLLQSALWFKLGFYRATNIACLVGMAVSGVLGVLALLSLNLFMLFLMFACFMTCSQTRGNLSQLADEVYEDERAYGGIYGGNQHPDRPNIGLPRVSFGGSGRSSKPKDDRFTMRDLNPLEWLAKRRRRKQFEKLMNGD